MCVWYNQSNTKEVQDERGNSMEDYAYASKKYASTIEKYRMFFNNVFRHEVIAFGYMRWLKSGEFVDLESSIEMQELFMEMRAYEDSPLLASYKNVNSGSAFRYFNQHVDNPKSNTTRMMLEEKYKVSHGFTITEKYPDYCEVIIWDFAKPARDMTMLEYQNTVLQDCIDNAKAIKACFNQFKQTLFPSIKDKDLYRLNLKDIKGENYETQKHIIVDRSKNTIREGLLKAGILEQKDLMLKDIKFTAQEKNIIYNHLKGMTAQEIAESMNRSRRTVEGGLERIKDKLGVKKKVRSSH